MKTRKGRARPRPLAVRNSMHLVLRSSRATGEWSFRRTANRKIVESILNKFAGRFGVRILSVANVGNHLHLHIQLTNRFTFKPFIRAITSAIAMAVTGINRWTKGNNKGGKFWDYRPFSRIVMGWKALLTLRDYIRINQLEGYGHSRSDAEFLIRRRFENSS